MSFKTVDGGGTLRTISAMKVVESSTVTRRILRMKVMDTDGSTLRTVATFVGPLSVSIEPSDATVVGSTVSFRLTATPAGGLGPYSYAWTLQSGSGWTIASPSSAITNASGPLSSSATFRCTVSDSSGQTAHADLST